MRQGEEIKGFHIRKGQFKLFQSQMKLPSMYKMYVMYPKLVEIIKVFNNIAETRSINC